MTKSFMKENGFYQQIEMVGVVPVAVIENDADAVPLAAALAAGGLSTVEVTFRTPAAASSIHSIAQVRPDVMIGAGTIINLAQCEAAVRAGAKFIVSPGFDEAVVEWCLSREINIIPASVTPTEIMAAIAKGIEVTKFFPSNLFGGLKAVEALASVFVGHRFMPTGGVNADNLRAHLSSPAVLGVGGTWMTKPALMAQGDTRRITELASQAASTVREIRG